MNKPEPVGTTSRSKILDIIATHEARIPRSINLVASENRLSAGALRALSADIAGRYAIPPRHERPKEIWDYPNQTGPRAVEAETQALACRLFGGGFANVRPLSGNNIAGIILAGMAARGDTVLTVPGWAGGHFATPPLCDLLGLNRLDIPYDAETQDVDMEALTRIAGTERPVLIYLDASMYLFPYPVKEMRALFPDAAIVYDASHTFGLIAGGEVQDPIGEGADMIVGSTHKSMPGPQKGIIVTRPGAPKMAAKIDATVTPLFVSNPHVHAIAALGVCLEELEAHGAAYAARVVRNARRLARRLEANGVKVMGADRGYTACHQVMVSLGGMDAEVAMLRLEAAGMHVNGVNLPFRQGQGLRLGISEMTRRGFGPDAIETVADCLAAVLADEAAVETARPRTEAISAAHPHLYYTFETGLPVLEDA